MKILGVILLVFASLNFFVAIAATSSGAEDATGQKMSSALLLAVIGGLLFYFGKQKENKKFEEEKLAKRKETERQQKLKEQKEKEEREKKRKEFELNSKKFKILNFYLDCSLCHQQEKEISKCPLALSVEIIDVDENDDIVEKYKVRNLPKLILVDYNGTEIKRWMGVTESNEINNFLYDNGYAIRNETTSISDNSSEPVNLEEDDDCEDYPKPMFVLGPDDMMKLMSEEYMDKYLDIVAEGGTKEQIQVKFEVLLGKREKTEAMLAIEQPIRKFFHEIYDTAGRQAYESSDNPLLRKIAVTTNLMNVYKEVNDENGVLYAEKNKMMEIANKFGVSINIIEVEEKHNAEEKYSK